MRNFNNSRFSKDKDTVRKNREIRAKEVRLINEKGDNIGVVSIQEAQKMANEAKLDLLEISPNTNPPVCKIMDYGKYNYEQQKKKAQAKKKQKVVELKELKFSPNIEKHDYDVKLKKAKQFLESGNKVKFSVRFKGREITHKEEGKKVFENVIEDLKDHAQIDLQPKFEGRNMVMILSPAAKK